LLGHRLRQFRVAQVRLPATRQGERHVQDHQFASVIALEYAVTVTEAARRCIHGARAAVARIEHGHAVKDVLDFEPVGANILDRRSAHGTGNERQVFQSADALGKGPLHEGVPVLASSCTDKMVGLIVADHLFSCEREVQNQPGKIAGQQHIAAAAQYQPRQSAPIGACINADQLLGIRDPQIGMGAGRDAESIEGLQGELILDG